MSEIALLRDAVLSLENAAVFAVFDGAQFADLPASLLDGGITHRPLYRNNALGDADRGRTTPQMVGPLEGDVLDKVLALLDEAGLAASVFWHCPDGPDSLYRHLRGINMVRIPKAAEVGHDTERDPTWPKQEGENEAHETVLFRHADANVLAQVVPALEPPGLARLIGPAEALFFLPSPDWRDPAARAPVRILRKQPDWPRAPSGMLTVQAAAIEAIGSRRAVAMRVKRIRLLRGSTPSLFKEMDDEAVATWAEQHERSGRAIGLTTERGLLQWTYLMGGSKGRFGDDPHIRAHLMAGSGTADRKLDAMMGLMVRASQDGRQ